MAKAHEYTHTVSVEIIGGDGSAEIHAELAYTVSPYYPEQGPTYDCGGQPAEGGDVEDCRVTRLYKTEARKVYSTVAGSPPTIEHIETDLECPEWLSDMICDSADKSHLVEHAGESDYDDRADYEYDMRRDDAMEA